jgi:hypothetical protein
MDENPSNIITNNVLFFSSLEHIYAKGTNVVQVALFLLDYLFHQFLTRPTYYQTSKQ